MGERKGQNHYYPPDFNWKVHKTLNSYHGVHALRERGKRAHEGILTIRFEMPFNVWCLGCNNHIAMSVRYNAEKRKIGMYYTTPLYEFRMKCHLCDNYFTIRTDPKNFDYELVEGLRRQEIRFDPSTIDNLAPVDRTMSLKLGADAMFKAEHIVDDKQKLASADQQIERLEVIQSRLYDDYAANSFLRGAFRREKKCLNEHRARDQALKERLSTELDLLPESKEDRLAAQRLTLSKFMTVEKEEKLTKEKLMSTPLSFQPPADGPSNSSPNSSASVDSKNALINKIRTKYYEQNMSMVQEDSSASAGGTKQNLKRRSLGICLDGERKRKEQVLDTTEDQTKSALPLSGLVNYDSSSSDDLL